MTAGLTCSTERRCTEYLWHWNSCEFFFLSSPVRWRDLLSPRVRFVRHLGCVHKALRLRVLADRCRLSPTSKSTDTRYKYFADVIVAQSWRSDLLEDGEGAGLRVTTYAYLCVCVCVWVGACAHVCVYSVSVCTHICTCFGLYMPMCMSQTTEREAERVSLCGNILK